MQTHVAKNPSYVIHWRTGRRKWRRFFAAFAFGWIPFYPLLLLPGIRLAWVVCMLLWFFVVGHLYMEAEALKCPRCRNWFTYDGSLPYSDIFTAKCLHCALPRGSVTDPDWESAIRRTLTSSRDAARPTTTSDDATVGRGASLLGWEKRVAVLLLSWAAVTRPFALLVVDALHFPRRAGGAIFAEYFVLLPAGLGICLAVWLDSRAPRIRLIVHVVALSLAGFAIVTTPVGWAITLRWGRSWIP
jgi:hypothetical protein